MQPSMPTKNDPGLGTGATMVFVGAWVLMLILTWILRSSTGFALCYSLLPLGAVLGVWGIAGVLRARISRLEKLAFVALNCVPILLGAWVVVDIALHRIHGIND